MVNFLVIAGAVLAADQPGEVMPDRHWDFLHLDLTVKIDWESEALEGTAVHQISPLGRPYGWVRLHQVALDIQQVLVNGDEVEGWRLGRETLDIPVPPGQDAEVIVRWTARPDTGMHFRGQPGSADGIREVWTQGENEENRHWFPGWDYPNDVFTVTTHVLVEEPFVAVANGVLHDKVALDGGWTKFTYTLDSPVVNYLIAVAAGEYSTYVDDGPVPLEYLASRRTKEEDVRRTLASTAEQMAFFNETLGTLYPFRVYRQLLVQRFKHSGMENAAFTVLNDELLLKDDDEGRLEAELLVAHELAHQWFGDLLFCYGWREMWLNEGFAEYYQLRWLEHRYGPEVAALRWSSTLSMAVEEEAPMSPRGWSGSEAQYSSVYSRGASVLHILRVYLGDEVFDAAIRRYVAEHRFELVESDDLRRVFEEESGTHLGWLFDQWVHGSAMPEMTSEHHWEEGQLEVTLGQSGEELLAMPVEIEVGTPKSVVVKEVWLDGVEARLVMPLAGPPLWVAVDPRGGVLGRWEHQQETQQWVAQLRYSPTPMAQIVALRQLGKGEASGASVQALRDFLFDKSREPTLRARAAGSLVELGVPRATDALLAGLEDPNHHIRQSAAAALGDGIGPQRVLLALSSAYRHDEGAGVRGAALEGLFKLDASLGLELARRALGDEELRSVALPLVGRKGEASDMERLLRFMGPRTPRPERIKAAWAAVDLSRRLTPTEAQRHRSRLNDLLLGFLADPDNKTQMVGILALASVGDGRAEQALRRLSKETTVVTPDFGRHARDAAEKIRQRLLDPLEKEPEADETALEERLDELEARLRRLELWR